MEIFQRNTLSSSESALTFAELFEINELKAQAQENDTTYKQLYDSIKSSRVRSKEQCDDLINKVNIKSAEVSDLNASLQEKVLVITALKEQLNKLKGKAVLTEAVSLNPIDPELLKVDITPLVPKLRKNRIAHTDYIRHTQEEAATLREIIENFACKYTMRIQKLMMILQQTCPSLTDLGTKLVAVTPKNKTKQIRRTEQIIKSGKTTVTTPPSANLDSNTPVLSSTGVILVSSASGSMSQDNTKKNRIWRTQQKAKNNKIEDHHRTVKSSLNKKSVVDSKATSSVINFVSHVNFDLQCASCNGCLFSDNHDACVVAYIKSVNASSKSKFVKKPVKRKVWKTTGNMFKTVRYIWKPTGRTFILVENVCPLTRIATPIIVPPREPISIVNSTDKPRVTLVYTRKPKAANKKVPNKLEPNNSWGSSSSNVPSSLLTCRLSKSSSVRCIRTDNGTEFVNQTLRDYYEEVGISHETSVARSPQQNGVVKRRNRIMIEAAHTIKLPDLSFFHVFGALCYPTNDSENLGKLQPKADIGIFIGYAPKKKAFRIYNWRTRRIVETIHVDFDELTAMASEQSSSGPALNDMTPGTISSGLVPPEVIAPVAEVIPQVDVDSTDSPSSTIVDQDAPSPSKSLTTTEIQSLVIPQDVGDDNLDMEVAHMGNDSLLGAPIPEVTSEQSSSTASPQSIVQPNHPMTH
nr:hypothetical protein [Tanacetum cinerariifolium]